MMKFKREKWWRNKLYEVYFQLDWTNFFLAITIADVDFEIHLINLRGVRNEK